MRCFTVVIALGFKTCISGIYKTYIHGMYVIKTWWNRTRSQQTWFASPVREYLYISVLYWKCDHFEFSTVVAEFWFKLDLLLGIFNRILLLYTFTTFWNGISLDFEWTTELFGVSYSVKTGFYDFNIWYMLHCHFKWLTASLFLREFKHSAYRIIFFTHFLLYISQPVVLFFFQKFLKDFSEFQKIFSLK